MLLHVMLEQLPIVCEKLVKMRENTELDTFWERATTTAEELQLQARCNRYGWYGYGRTTFCAYHTRS